MLDLTADKAAALHGQHVLKTERDRALAALARVEALADQIESAPMPRGRAGLSNRAKARLTRYGHGRAAALSLAQQFRRAITGEAT